MRETIFTAQITRDLREQGIYCKNHYTVPFSVGLRFQSSNPCDFYLVRHGRYFAFESKQVKGSSLPLSRIRDHQTDDLRAVWRAGGRAYYLINVREVSVEKAPTLLKYYAWRGSVLAAMLVRPTDFEACERAVSENRKSIPLESLVDCSCLVFGRKDGRWDVRRLLLWLDKEK